MRWVVGVVGIALLAIVLWDAFETIILPRRISGRFRLAKLFYRTTWPPWRAVAPLLPRPPGDAFLSFYGPLSLLLLPALYAAGIVLAHGGRAVVALPGGYERRGARRAAPGVGAVGRRCARESLVLSRARLLPIAAFQPVLAGRADDDARRQRPRVGGAGRRVRGAGQADVRHGAPRGRGLGPGVQHAAA